MSAIWRYHTLEGPTSRTAMCTNTVTGKDTDGRCSSFRSRGTRLYDLCPPASRHRIGARREPFTQNPGVRIGLGKGKKWYRVLLYTSSTLWMETNA